MSFLARVFSWNRLVPCWEREAQSWTGVAGRIEKAGYPNQGQNLVMGDLELNKACVFLLDSMFLRRCKEALISGPDEKMAFVTGPAIGNFAVVPLCIMRPRYEVSSPFGAQAEAVSKHRILCRFENEGHLLLGIFHSHPGTGPWSVRESSTDVENQERYESVGYRIISGIFSRDGFVRFFSNRFPFRVRIYGNGIEEVRDNVYRIA